ncbi:hypothetical protein P22_0580 [Propionispora sp. 2/2-37]|uniref:CPBP family intramembrane glutamic endopeptidase n=1 Tax=Propionispora sp. 2/2-37 TaxID=1677858 RepID=UPI0006BB8F1F|nr:CPBP family intramembrane glutamic endopeptidase [Propionispora sp. 2/2-37]CUH94514.1 hypothetical protein P22_0580 [Propionispora sp. 2/2-37]
MGFFLLLIVFGSLLTVAWPFTWIYPILLAYFPTLAHTDTDDVLSRVVMLVVALLVWYLYPRMELPSMQLGSINRQRIKLLVYSFAAGCAAVIVYYIAKWLSGDGIMEWGRFIDDRFFRNVLWYLVGALTVAFLEEVFFRGIVYKAFWQDFRRKFPAAIMAAAFFGSLHWISFKWLLRWAGGQESIIREAMSLEFLTLDSVGMFLLITTLGLLLIYGYEHSGSLYVPIGIHAGIVFASRIGRKVAVPATPYSNVDILSVTGANVPYLILAILTALFLLYFIKNRSRYTYRIIK